MFYIAVLMLVISLLALYVSIKRKKELLGVAAMGMTAVSVFFLLVVLIVGIVT